VDRIKYGYDRVGSRLWRENVVARSLGKEFDELYTYDAAHRLKNMSRGTLNGGRTALTSTTFAQCWGLDATGNWSNFREDDDGDGSWNLNQNRTANKVNEITNVTESTGPGWVTPAYSAAGNMTTVPKPADPTTSFTATYDAWNRLVKLVDTTSSNTVAEYEYDAAKRRVIQKSYTGGSLDETRHLFYTEPRKWQVIEERVDSDTDPNRQFVWGLRYIDDLVLRDRDTTGNGTLDERRYALQDANWNVTSTADTSGTVQQRMVYQAYGTPVFLTNAFASGTNSDDWETLYAGYRWDAVAILYHVRHRCMNSVIGCWNQCDPLRYADSLNLLAYGVTSPLTYRDPRGCSILPDGGPDNPWFTFPVLCKGRCLWPFAGPNNCATPCKDAIKKGLFRKLGTNLFDSGITVCCDGQKYPCYYRPPEWRASKAVAICIKAHEQHHIDNGDLSDCWPCGLWRSNAPIHKEAGPLECPAYKVQKKCMDDHVGDCDKLDTDEHIAACKKSFDLAYQSIEANIKERCASSK